MHSMFSFDVFNIIKLLILSSQPLQRENDSVAQLVEHYTFNVVVLGSNPSGITRMKASQKCEAFALKRTVFLTLP